MVAERLAHAVFSRRPLALSTVTLHEIWIGIAGRSPGDEPKLRRLLEQVDLIDWTADDAIAASRLRADMRRLGRAIGAIDSLLAGQAQARGAAVATSNLREFARVPGLLVENWREPQSA